MPCHSSPLSTTRHSHAGFALIEVLICILVLTVGLIGAALMQLHASRTTEQSSLHDTALALAMQIADELRANDAQTRLQAGANPFLPFAYTVPVQPVFASTATDCYRQSCTSRQMADESMREWRLRADLVLRAGGRIEICRDAGIVAPTNAPLNWCNGVAGADSTVPVAVKIGWSERDADGRTVVDQAPRVAVVVSPFSQ